MKNKEYKHNLLIITTMDKKTQTAIFGAGCFWGVEEAFRTLNGVILTEVGYSGGSYENPTYEDVCSDMTGHAEVVQIEYDPTAISYKELLKVFWRIHKPTQVDRQGPDFGSQYRSVIFYTTESQRKEARESLTKEQKSYDDLIATQIVPAELFWRAEDYHQQYVKKTGRKVC